VSSSNPWSDLPEENETPEPAYPLLRRASDQQPQTAAPGQPGEDVSGRAEVGTIEVIVRLIDGDAVLVGRFGDVEDAKECAEGLVESLGGDERQWPFVGGRFLRPAAIVSIDVNESGPKWAGSPDRAASWTRAQQRLGDS
jgi:hypothetical protein